MFVGTHSRPATKTAHEQSCLHRRLYVSHDHKLPTTKANPYLHLFLRNLLGTEAYTVFPIPQYYSRQIRYLVNNMDSFHFGVASGPS